MTSFSAAAQNAYSEIDVRQPKDAASTRWSFDYAINGRFLAQPLTGVQRYATEVVRGLDEILAERDGSADIFAPRLAKRPSYKSIRFAVSPFTTGYIWEQAELPLRASRPVLSLCNVGPLASAEQIICVHDANVFRCPESYSRSFRLFYRAVLPRLARRAARLTTVSNAARREIAHFFALSEKDIAVLSNGHEHVFGWRAERSALRDLVGSFRPFVLMIGSRALHKNNGLVLGLAQALDELKLDVVVVGAKSAIFVDPGQQKASNVHVLGRVSDDDLACLYRRALCLAFPSLHEGFGLPLVEAMALGCPIVASPIASSLEVCGDSAHFAAGDDAEQWLRGVTDIARSADFRAELSGRGRLRARCFSWRQSAEGYLNLAKEGRP
jgi:glycosyltransferase involved in cell wall biosynthesis